MKINYEKYIREYEKYATYELNLAKHTINSYVFQLGKFFEWVSINKDRHSIKSIQSDDLSEYIMLLTKNGKKSSTTNAVRNSVSALYKYLLKKKIVSKNITTEVAQKKIPKRIPIVLKYDEQLELLKASNDPPFRDEITKARVRLAVRLFSFTGLRLDEISNLKFSDIDDWIVNVQSGKGDKQRTVPIPDEAIDLIKNLIDEYKEFRISKKIDSDYIFVSNRKNKMSNTQMYNDIKALFKMIGRPDLTPHKLRATYATNLLEATGNIKYVAELMGHNSLATTEIYTQVSTKNKKDAVNKMDSSLFI